MTCSPRQHAARPSWKSVLASLCMAALGVAMCPAATPAIITAMASNETAARQHQSHFAYTSDERSDRTGGHLWREHVVEIGDGMLRQLVAVDGTPLTPAQAAAESQRLQALVANPDEFRRLAQAHKDDEVHATRLLQLLPRAFMIVPDGTKGECLQFRFEPDPNFQPSGFEERVGAAMAGTISVMEPTGRLCTLQASIQHPVTFGFGLIGRIEQGGNFRLERIPIKGSDWKTRAMSVHMGGKILLAKSLAKQQETVRTEIRAVPDGLTLQQGLDLIRP
ncbi:hypothetical protein [Terriglobus roseus]|uniref:Uncharacterized protein n=1 Tax=Terriglobus roseus TaxID=392734 RepID=A0A1H4QGZ1_9BACT|nr:hypothetical protein [Terriglobus roseus]SEC18860.1 hypothetical protein SAMN05443244_2870 [Terriglobus roseus]